MGKFGAFMAGGIVGAGLALLLSPRNGAENRQMVVDKCADVLGSPREILNKGRETVCNVDFAEPEAEAEAAMPETVSFESQAPAVEQAFAEKTEDLRAKIEAARQRIASQVAKNVAPIQDAATNVFDSVASVASSAMAGAADAISSLKGDNVEAEVIEVAEVEVAEEAAAEAPAAE